jgi:ornithine carbamoyltransferase
MHDLLRIADLSREELLDLLEMARRAKADRHAFRDAADGCAVAVLFEKPSLRTRFSVEVALTRVGAFPVGAYDLQSGFGTREPVADGGRVLERYADAIVMRTFAHERLQELAGVVSVPVVNALSDAHHPLQGLADLMTVAEAGPLDAARVAWIGDGNNVVHSLLEACALAEVPIAVATPPGYEPDPAVVAWASERTSVELTDDPRVAVKDATVVTTDVWASMGQETETAERARVFDPYRVTTELMGRAADGAVFLHCLPAHRGDEVEADVIDGEASRVFDQAENRLHTATALFARLLGGR